MIHPYKGRLIDLHKEIKVYKNLHNKKWSLLQDNLVVAHADSLQLNNCRFQVNETLRLRVISSKKKKPHAFVVGQIDLSHADLPPSALSKLIKYDPYINSTFICTIGEVIAVKMADRVWFTADGCVYGIGLTS